MGRLRREGGKEGEVSPCEVGKEGRKGGRKGGREEGKKDTLRRLPRWLDSVSQRE